MHSGVFGVSSTNKISYCFNMATRIILLLNLEEPMVFLLYFSKGSAES